MPILQKRAKSPGFLLRDDTGGREEVYDLSPEGERFLTAVLSLKDGDPVRPADFALLKDRGWATPLPPEPDPVPAARPEASPAPIEPPPRPVSVSAPSSASRRSEAPRSGATRRTRGREVALQVLYQMEQNSGSEPLQIDQFLRRRLSDDKLQAFTRGLVAGVREHQARIDELISGVAENWRIDRMAAIDRNILRLGAYEMLYCSDVPTKVAINEALELAKRYSTAQSSRFVNGILDRLQDLGTASPDAATESPAESPAPEPPAEA